MGVNTAEPNGRFNLWRATVQSQACFQCNLGERNQVQPWRGQFSCRPPDGGSWCGCILAWAGSPLEMRPVQPGACDCYTFASDRHTLCQRPPHPLPATATPFASDRHTLCQRPPHPLPATSATSGCVVGSASAFGVAPAACHLEVNFQGNDQLKGTAHD